MADYDAASVLNPRTLPPLVRQDMSGIADAGIDNPAQFMLDPSASANLYDRARRALTTQYPFLENDPNFNNDLKSSFQQFMKEGVQRSVDPNQVWSETVMPTLAKWQMNAARQYQSGQAQAQAGYEGLVDKVGAGAALQANPSILSTPMHDRALASVDQERLARSRNPVSPLTTQYMSQLGQTQRALMSQLEKLQAVPPQLKKPEDLLYEKGLQGKIDAIGAKIEQLAGQASSPSTSATESAGSSLSSAPPLPSFDQTPTRYGQVYGDRGQFINTNPTKLSHGQHLRISGMGTPTIELSGDEPATSTAASDLGGFPPLTESYADIPTGETITTPAPVKKAAREVKKTLANSGIVGMIPEALSAASELLGSPIEQSRQGKYGILPQALTQAGDAGVDTVRDAASALSGAASIPVVANDILFGTPETPLPMPTKVAAPAAAVPDAAIKFLVSHPETKDLFDEKYGKGASDKYLVL